MGISGIVISAAMSQARNEDHQEGHRITGYKIRFTRKKRSIGKFGVRAVVFMGWK